MKVTGKSILARICEAARGSRRIDKVVVAWAHKFPHLDENNVLGRFQEIVKRYEPDYVVRLTSDCPLLTSFIIDASINSFLALNTDYYSNHWDGYDVQVFKPEVLWTPGLSHPEHVIADFRTPSSGLSVNTEEDLKRVNRICSENGF